MILPFFNCSQSSSIAALNTLELFGSFSGLIMNTEKTKVIWIGKKRHDKTKLLDRGLSWGHTDFDLLGLKFSTNLNSILNINYKEKLHLIKQVINTWDKRYLTPMGRITVVKTFILSKLNHLFLALPSPDHQFQKTFEDLCFKFIWSNKPDKINRKTLMLEKQIGGLKMVNLKKFEKSLKTTWFRRLLRQTDTPWVKLFQVTFEKKLDKFVKLGPQYILKVNNTISNQFWNDVFKAAYGVLEHQVPLNSKEILTTPLWYNSKLLNDLFLSDWFRRGIFLISDILDSDGNIMSLEMLEHLYGIKHKNFLNYLSVKGKCSQFLKNNDFVNESLLRPNIPNHVRILYRSEKGTRDIYKHISTTKTNTHPMKVKWNRDLNLFINDITWRDIFKVCFYTSNDNYLVWFQLRILYRILGTNSYLNKIGLSPSSFCRNCKNDTETLMHIFTECPSVKLFWGKIQNHVKEYLNFDLNLSNVDIILGYLLFHQHRIPINALILVTKKYIFDCIRYNTGLHLDRLIRKLQQYYVEEKLLAVLKDKYSEFNKIWERWKPLFE